MEWLTASLEFARYFVRYILTGFVMYGVFMVVERIRPAERHQPLKHVWFNLAWYVLYTIVSLALQAAGIGAIVGIAQGWIGGPLLDLPVPQSAWSYGLLALLYFLITDFFYYWFHRWQHKRAFLWEQHKFSPQ